jgi:hypothetical protein
MPTYEAIANLSRAQLATIIVLGGSLPHPRPEADKPTVGKALTVAEFIKETAYGAVLKVAAIMLA